MDIFNNKYLIENENITIYRTYINLSIILILTIILFVITFEYDKKKVFITESNKILVMLSDKNAKIKIDDKSYKPKILKKNFYYEAEINLKETKRIKVEVEEKTSIYKSIIFDFRKELHNAENIQ